MSNDLDLEKVLESAPDAVPLNQTALQIIKRAGDPSTTASDIAAILREDQALSARVLKIANSAFYGLPRQIGSIKSAVLLLGQKTIRNLALTATMSGAIEKPISGYGLPRGELFRHSLVVARAASQIASETNRSVADEAYTAGLLHDIGKLVLDEHIESRVGAIAEMARDESISFAEAERRLMGMDHGEVGAILAEKWGLPDFLADAIRSHHHAPSGRDSEETAGLVAVCMLANRLARTLGTGVGANETPDPDMPSVILEILGLSPKDVPELTKEVQRQIDETGGAAGED